MLRFCRPLDYNFIILKYACNRFELQFSYFPCKNWIVEVFIKFQIPKRISARFFPHCFQDGLFAQFGPNECAHQIPLLHFAKSSLSWWLFSAYCSWIICIPFLQLFHLTFSFVGYFLLFAKIALGYHDWPRDHVNQKPF